MVCQSCSPLKLSTTSVPGSLFKLSNIMTKIYTLSESNISSERPVAYDSEKTLTSSSLGSKFEEVIKKNRTSL